MARPKDVLSPADYKNYRNVRAVSVLFILVGSVLVLGGIALALGESPEELHPAVGVGMAVAGLAGVVGGIATLRGNRRWAPLIYVMAALYLFGIPIGTILSVVIFTGLRRYLGSVERLRAAQISS